MYRSVFLRQLRLTSLLVQIFHVNWQHDSNRFFTNSRTSIRKFSQISFCTATARHSTWPKVMSIQGVDRYGFLHHVVYTVSTYALGGCHCSIVMHGVGKIKKIIENFESIKTIAEIKMHDHNLGLWRHLQSERRPQ